MIYMPSLLLFLLLLLVFPFIWFALTVDVVQVAVAKLGFSANVALLLFGAVIIGSTIDSFYKNTVVFLFIELESG